jgi:hypothetical protein
MKQEEDRELISKEDVLGFAEWFYKNYSPMDERYDCWTLDSGDYPPVTLDSILKFYLYVKTNNL